MLVTFNRIYLIYQENSTVKVYQGKMQLKYHQAKYKTRLFYNNCFDLQGVFFHDLPSMFVLQMQKRACDEGISQKKSIDLMFRHFPLDLQINVNTKESQISNS